MSGRWTRRAVSNKTCQEDEKEENWKEKKYLKERNKIKLHEF